MVHEVNSAPEAGRAPAVQKSRMFFAKRVGCHLGGEYQFRRPTQRFADSSKWARIG